MADNFFPTVIQPDIPENAMTSLERLLLNAVFEQETDAGEVYFYSSEGANDMPSVPVSEALAGLTSQPGVESRTADLIRKALANESLDPHGEWLTLDLSVTGWAFIFQDIVRRCDALDHVSVITAWTCTRMYPDGFGGSAMVITADDIRCKTTYELVEDMLSHPSYGLVGVHALGQLKEANVRWVAAELLTANPDPAFTADAVNGLDIRYACIAAAESVDFNEQVRAAEQHAARMAIEAVRSRAA